jgi:hypothetical protein
MKAAPVTAPAETAILGAKTFFRAGEGTLSVRGRRWPLESDFNRLPAATGVSNDATGVGNGHGNDEAQTDAIGCNASPAQRSI